MAANDTTDIRFRPYDHKKDCGPALQVFREVSWLGRGSGRQADAAATAYFKASRCWVAELRGRAESVAVAGPGEFRYLEESLRLCAVISVATSTIVRRLNCATRISAEAVADAAEEGAEIAGLGVFEQGFYERLGFGAGPYEHWFDFDPESLKVGVPRRAAHRLSVKDWKAVYRSLLGRMRNHGSCRIFVPELIRLEMVHESTGFGLGYYEGGELTHHVWLSNQGGEHGPLFVNWMAYRSYVQLLELLSVLRSLGDQFHLVKMREPPGIQLQDLIERPFKHQRVTRQARFECRARAAAYWQMRILDLKGCIEKTHLPGPGLSFNLELSDPIGEVLRKRRSWRGVAGRYTVHIGERSAIEAGETARLPTLSADIGSFTRMWMGAGRASALSLTGGISAPAELIRSLDKTFQIPQPHTDWDF
jgi:predicted acetyltransferase